MAVPFYFAGNLVLQGKIITNIFLTGVFGYE